MALSEGLKSLAGISELGVLKRLRRWNDVVEPRPSMDPAVRREVIAAYRDDVACLSRLLQLDLSNRWLGEAPQMDNDRVAV